jgi:hypothetical protein
VDGIVSGVAAGEERVQNSETAGVWHGEGSSARG